MRFERLPPEGQERIARITVTLAGENEPPADIDPDYPSDVVEGLAEARRGEFAIDAEVAAFSRFGK